MKQVFVGPTCLGSSSWSHLDVTVPLELRSDKCCLCAPGRAGAGDNTYHPSSASAMCWLQDGFLADAERQPSSPPPALAFLCVLLHLEASHCSQNHVSTPCYGLATATSSHSSFTLAHVFSKYQKHSTSFCPENSALPCLRPCAHCYPFSECLSINLANSVQL